MESNKSKRQKYLKKGIKPTQKEKEARKLIVNEIEKATQLLEDFWIKYCKDNQTKAVNIEVLKASRQVMLKSYKDGISKK